LNLSELTYGQSATVLKVTDDYLALKLFEMGLLPGEQVELENVAPFGDPIAVRVGEYKMCLRIEDAKHIQIQMNENRQPTDLINSITT
jgi:ferrous iron transport protein A